MARWEMSFPKKILSNNYKIKCFQSTNRMTKLHGGSKRSPAFFTLVLSSRNGKLKEKKFTNKTEILCSLKSFRFLPFPATKIHWTSRRWVNLVHIVVINCQRRTGDGHKMPFGRVQLSSIDSVWTEGTSRCLRALEAWKRKVNPKWKWKTKLSKNGTPKSLFATSIEGFNPKFDFTHSWTDHWNEDLLSVIGIVINITKISVRTFENVCTQKRLQKKSDLYEIYKCLTILRWLKFSANKWNESYQIS